MKSINKLATASLLVFVLALPSFAGDMNTPGVTLPPPPPPPTEGMTTEGTSDTTEETPFLDAVEYYAMLIVATLPLP